MAKSSTVLTIAIIMLLLAFAPSIEGKPTGKADASGGCTCHAAGGPTVTANHNFPTTYTPGATYNIQITIQGGVVGSEGGFALEVDEGAFSNNGPDVQFTPMSPPPGGMATHTNPSARSWSFDWNAPPAGSGVVSVALATLTSNGDNLNDNDAWGTTTHTINELISNQAPSATNVQVSSTSTSSKTNVVENTSIGISYIYSDSDNDPEQVADTEIRWYKDNVIQQMYDQNDPLPASAISAGESWHATVAPHDGTTLGVAVQSNSITVDAVVITNNAPTVTNYEITAATPGSNVPVNESLLLNYVYNDIDDDSESGTAIIWFNTGIAQTAWNDATTLPASATSVGDSWSAKITPSDGMDSGIAYETASVTIIDIDTDGDGVLDEEDVFPNNINEWMDTDSDGLGDNEDAFPNNETETMDSDFDGVGDNTDSSPYDSTQWSDMDGDGYGDNASGTDPDVFKTDATQWKDSDGDGYGDNQSGNNPDRFPNDANETMDSDNDTVGDNADAFPNDANETMDSDGNGVGDNAQAVAEAKDAKLAAEQSELYMMIGIAAVVIILSLAAVAVFMKKKGSDELALAPKQYDNPQPIAQTQQHEALPITQTQQHEPEPITQTQQHEPQPTVVAAATEVQRWTDDAGHTWRTMTDNSTEWWNGSDWQQR